MSSDDNLIQFPGLKKRNEQRQKESSIAEENKASFSFKEDVINFPGSQKMDTPSVEEQRKESVDSTFSKNGRASDSSETSIQNTQGNHRNSQYTFAAVTCALCLMLVGFPFLNRYSQNSESRGLAANQGEAENIQLQEEKALNLIQSGQRKIASIGKKPGVKDIFSIEFLKSRYNVRWNEGKLVYAVLLEDREPVTVANTDKIVGQYGSLFPAYTNIRKLDSLSGDLEIYELQDKEGLNTAQVETLKDVEGRLLSIHVTW